MDERPVHPELPALKIGARLAGIVLAAVVVFSLGVMVGKRVVESVPTAVAPPAAPLTESLQPQPAAPPAAAVPVPPEKLTFYDRLSGAAPPPPVATPAGQVPPQATASAALPAAPGVPATLPAVATSETAPRPSRAKAAGRKKLPQASDTTAPSAPAATPDASFIALSRAAAESQISQLAGKGRYSVQVAAVNERAAADQTAARLRREGFGVDTATVILKGKTWYRIRVGPFPNRNAAAKASGIFRSVYGLNAIPVQE